MSEPKWTKGDWRIETDNPNGALFIVAVDPDAKECWNIAQTFGDAGSREIDGQIESCANANLIAAAPELYDALEAVMNEIDKGRPLVMLHKTILGARSALAKARGE